MTKTRLVATAMLLLLVSACSVPSSLVPTTTHTPTPTATHTLVPTATPTPVLTATHTPVPTPTPPPLPDYTRYFPPRLAKDFYPNGVTREALLARLPQAVKKTGTIKENETWEGVIRITGDLRIPPGVSVTIAPGTLVFVSAHSDDQMSGHTNEKDRYNPKVPVCDLAYSRSRVFLGVDGSLVARGTREQPIIVTSDAIAPETDDWLGIQFGPGATGDLRRVIVEYARIIGLASGDVTFRQAIIRNLMVTIVIMGHGDELLTMSPTITESYIYNTGQAAITVRSGAPTITNNVIRPRQDLELHLPGFEYAGVGVDHPAKPTIHHNFLEGGPPVRYDEYDIMGKYREFIEATALTTHASSAPMTIAYNTFYGGSNTGLEVFPSPVTIEHNNFIDNKSNLQVQDSLYEPSDAWQQELFAKGVIKPLRTQSIQAINNFWGTVSRREIARSIQTNRLVQLEFEPFQTSFIEAALPPWRDFPW